MYSVGKCSYVFVALSAGINKLGEAFVFTLSAFKKFWNSLILFLSLMDFTITTFVAIHALEPYMHPRTWVATTLRWWLWGHTVLMISACLPTCLPACLPSYLPTYLAIYLSLYLSINLSIYLSIYLKTTQRYILVVLLPKAHTKW